MIAPAGRCPWARRLLVVVQGFGVGGRGSGVWGLCACADDGMGNTGHNKRSCPSRGVGGQRKEGVGEIGGAGGGGGEGSVASGVDDGTIGEGSEGAGFGLSIRGV